MIGANGQVGTEVCLFLSLTRDVRVVPICRTPLSSVFLRRCGLECRHGEIEDADRAAALLEGCDVVVDCSFPGGPLAERRARIRRILVNAVHHAPRDARFVYMSSISAFGMGQTSRTFRRYAWARTSYGAQKRWAERLAVRLCRTANHPLYVLRLGQVHGELQGVSRNITRGLLATQVFVPTGLSYTVFAFTISEALTEIARGREAPGHYTLVSSPEWTWQEVHEFYCRRQHVVPAVVLTNTRAAADGAGGLSRIAGTVGADMLARARKYIEPLASHLTAYSPALECQLTATYNRFRAASEIAQTSGYPYAPYAPYEGSILGCRLVHLSDSRLTMESSAAAVRDIVLRAAQQSS